MSYLIRKLAIVGMGLMGGSLAQALKARDLVGEVVGIDRSRATIDTAVELGVIPGGCTRLEEGVAKADLVVLATPVAAVTGIMEGIAPHLAKGAVVTDVGSVKGRIVHRCQELLERGGVGAAFVGGHPIAGREHSGVRAALPDLFEGSRTILTPTPATPPWALEKVRLMWEGVGSQVELMDPDYHDRVLAATSHLPHLMAYNVVNTLSDLEDHLRAEVFRYAASGFRDFTRIASSDPTMWRDICLENREAILDILGRFKGDLEKLMNRIEQGDADGLYGIFARSKSTRERVLRENKILRGES